MCTSAGETHRRGGLVAAMLLLGACQTEGVLPEGLRERGSLGSVEYAAADLYPGLGSALELVRPRLGSPLLLDPGEDALSAVVWLADTAETSALEVTAHAVSGDAFPLTTSGPPDCDALGLCRLTLELTAEVPPDALLGLCVETPSGARCHPGAIRRFAEVPAPLRVAHVTDPHFLWGARGDSRESRLRYLLGRLGEQRPAVHLVALTGDLADDGSPGAAGRIARVLGESPLPVIAVPGNHDFKDGGIVHYLEALTPELNHAHRLGPYLLLALDSGPGRWEQERRGWNGESAGLEAAQIAWLQAQLAGAFDAGGEGGASLLLLHHPPYSALGMTIGKRCRDLVRAARAGGVAAILAGHTHRLEVFDWEGVGQGLSIRCEGEVPQRRQPVTLVGAMALDRLEGGFRLVELHPDGRLGYCFVPVGWP